MLIVDINTLQTVNLLNFGDDVVLNSLRTINCKDISWVDRTLCEWLTGCNSLSLTNSYLVAVWDCIRLLLRIFSVLTCNSDLLGLLDLLDPNYAVDPCDDSSTLWTSALKQFLDSRKTLCNIFRRSDTTCVEGSHCKLCTRLTDRLSGDYADSLTDLNDISVCKVSAVALSANAVLSLTLKNRSDRDRILALSFECSNYSFSVMNVYELVS